MRHIGYCKYCGNLVGDEDRGKHCRCGVLLLSTSVIKEAPKPVTVQTGHDLLKRPFKKMIKGVKNGR